jgi:ABC-type spermidine/putrescine transport system permease subunit II
MTTSISTQTHVKRTRKRVFARLASTARYLPIAPAVLFLAAFFILPVGEILQGSLLDPAGKLGFGQFYRIAHTPAYANVLWMTFAISTATAVLSTALGYPIAYLMSQQTKQTRQRWLFWLLLPFWTSYLVKTYAWMLLLSKTGVLTTISLALGLINERSGLAPSLLGVLIAMVHAMLPLAVMTMLPAMQSIDNRLVQAAATLGADRATSFFTVFLPLSSTGVAAAGLLVFISSLGFFIVPALLGTPKETMIAQLVIGSVLDLLDLRLAGALSVVLLICAIAIFVIYDRMVGLSSLAGEMPAENRRGYGGAVKVSILMTLGRLSAQIVGGRTVQSARLKGICNPLRLYSALALALMALPIISIIPYSFTENDYIAFPPKLFSLKWFSSFSTSQVWQNALVRSLEVGIVTAFLSLALGFSATLALTRMSSRLSKTMFAFLVAPLILPRIVVAVGLLFLFSRLGMVGTNLGLMVGHTVLAIPYVVVTLAPGFRHFDWRLDDAAQIMGASPITRLRTVILPLLAASITSSLLFAFIVSFDDLTIAIFVSGGINSTLPKQMWDDIQLAVTPTLAAVSTTLVVLIALIVFLSNRLRTLIRDK